MEFRIIKTYFFLLLSLVSLSLSGQEKEEVSISKINSIPDNAAITDILIDDTLVYVAANTGLYLINANTFETSILREVSCDALIQDSIKIMT